MRYLIGFLILGLLGPLFIRVHDVFGGESHLIWQIGEFDGQFVTNSLGLEHFVVYFYDVDNDPDEEITAPNFPQYLILASSPPPEISGMSSANEIKIQFYAMNDLNQVVLEYARGGAEMDRIYLDGTFVGMVGGGEEGVTSTYTLSLSNISFGYHILSFTLEDAHIADDLHYIDAIALSAEEVVHINEIAVRDVADDQGGEFEISWKSFPFDDPGLPDSIVSYDAQRYEMGSWTILTTIAAAQADSYQVMVSTPDIFTIGQPEPFSKYRVVANSSDPAKLFYSTVDSAYSIDNLAPPKPDAQLYDSTESRVILWSNHATVPDLASMCVFRGDVEGFEPIDPLVCPSDPMFVEDHLAWYFYRVQYMDIHGNLSEFSDELHGQYPTGVEIPKQPGFSSFTVFPTPFNATVQLSFELNTPASISLDIYSLDGKRVATVANGFYGEGSQRFTWNGRNEAGRELSSGVYFAKLVAGEQAEVQRLILVK